MKYNRLGQTELMVSQLSFGAASIGTPGKEIDERTSVRTVREALALGINLIDISPYYGLTRAETLVGEALRGIPRDSYLLATKAGRYGRETFDFSPERVERSLDESLRRLGTDYVDIFQLHDIEFAPLPYIVEESIPALRRLKAEGKIRYFGVTALPLAALETVLALTSVDMVLSYCHYTLNDTTLTRLLPQAEARGVGVISAAPVAMGLLSEQGPMPWHPADDEIKAVCRQAAKYCARKGESLTRLALQFAASHPSLPTTLVGTASPELLRQNAQWLQEPLDEALLDEVRRMLAPIRDRSWPSGLL